MRRNQLYQRQHLWTEVAGNHWQCRSRVDLAAGCLPFFHHEKCKHSKPIDREAAVFVDCLWCLRDSKSVVNRNLNGIGTKWWMGHALFSGLCTVHQWCFPDSTDCMGACYQLFQRLGNQSAGSLCSSDRGFVSLYPCWIGCRNCSGSAGIDCNCGQYDWKKKSCSIRGWKNGLAEKACKSVFCLWFR